MGLSIAHPKRVGIVKCLRLQVLHSLWVRRVRPLSLSVGLELREMSFCLCMFEWGCVCVCLVEGVWSRWLVCACFSLARGKLPCYCTGRLPCFKRGLHPYGWQASRASTCTSVKGKRASSIVSFIFPNKENPSFIIIHIFCPLCLSASQRRSISQPLSQSEGRATSPRLE